MFLTSLRAAMKTNLSYINRILYFTRAIVFTGMLFWDF